MIDVIYSTRFRRDFKRCQKRGCDMNLLKEVVNTLRIPKPLPLRCRNHLIIGNYAGFYECHIKPDWLLIYKYGINGELHLYRTGTHSDLLDL